MSELYQLVAVKKSRLQCKFVEARRNSLSCAILPDDWCACIEMLFIDLYVCMCCGTKSRSVNSSSTIIRVCDSNSNLRSLYTGCRENIATSPIQYWLKLLLFYTSVPRDGRHHMNFLFTIFLAVFFNPCSGRIDQFAFWCSADRWIARRRKIKSQVEILPFFINQHSDLFVTVL